MEVNIIKDMQRGNNYNNNNNNHNGTGVHHQACASCKHQRKKCSEDCTLAPYFPADRNQEFQAVHKVFGVSNVMKLVRNVSEEHRKSVADSLIWEAICRQNDPVLGALGEFRKMEEECRKIGEELKFYKNQFMYKHNSWNGMNNKGNCIGRGLGNNNVIGRGLVNNNPNGNGIGRGLVNNKMTNYSHESGNVIFDSIPFDYYHYMQDQEKAMLQGLEKVKQEKEVNSLIVPQQEQLSIGGPFDQHNYYGSGHQFGSINGKIVDNTIWPDEP